MRSHPAPPLRLLAAARRHRRLSQLQLALQLGVSQRHVSFVESGRSRPSRELMIAWLELLDAPLAVRNDALREAGYAPVYTDDACSPGPASAPGAPGAHDADAAMHLVHGALRALLTAHDPLPAMVLDAAWTVRDLNAGAAWLGALVLPSLRRAATDPARTTGAPNLLDALIHDAAALEAIDNLDVVGPLMLARLRREAAHVPELAERVALLETRLADRLGTRRVHAAVPDGAPVLTTRYRTPFGVLSFFGTFTSFGTPFDVTLASLRVEHLFPADEHTRTVLRREVTTAD